VFEDESGVSLLPSVRATWAPRGHTPVLRHRFNWKRLSLAGALAYEPDGSDAHLVFELRPGAYNDESLIEFLHDLNKSNSVQCSSSRMDSPRIVVGVWPTGSTPSVTGYPSSNCRGSHLILNPLEQVWGNLKSQELANLSRDTIDEVVDVAQND
jgi:hypothetical protein